MPSWFEALRSEDLGLAFEESSSGGGTVIAGKHFAATQTMDEEARQRINFMGAFGYRGAVIKSVRKEDEETISFSAVLLKPGEDIGMKDEDLLRQAQSFKVVTRRGANNFRIYDECEWARVAVNSTLDQVTLNADISHPQQA